LAWNTQRGGGEAEVVRVIPETRWLSPQMVEPTCPFLPSSAMIAG